MLKILVAVDGSELSLDAVQHALHLRQEGLAAALVLANVREPHSLYEMVTVRDPQRLAGLSASAGEHSLQAARERCHAAGVVDYEYEVATGDPAHTLIDIAERYGCSAILAGPRGKGGLGGAALGSVAQELIHVSPLPVTIVKHPQAQERCASRRPPRRKAWPPKPRRFKTRNLSPCSVSPDTLKRLGWGARRAWRRSTGAAPWLARSRRTNGGSPRRAGHAVAQGIRRRA